MHTTGLDWKNELQTCLTAYKLTKHSILDKSTAKLIFGRPVQTKVSEAKFINEAHKHY